jgi:hypothetical protein
MKKTIPSLILVAAVSAIAVPTAYAYDSDVRSDWIDIRRDRAKITADARRVQEERDELAAARQHERWAFWRGNFWAAHRAAEQARDERSELWAARNKLNRDVADVQRDRADLYQDTASRRHWWGY